MADDYVPLIDSAAATRKIDNSSVTRADGTIVDRQRINISDPTDVDAHATVAPDLPHRRSYGLAVRFPSDALPLPIVDSTGEILEELRRIRRGIGKLVGDPFLNDD